MKTYYLNTEELKDYSGVLKPYDKVFLSGEVFTARDAAHKKLKELHEKGEKLPINLENAVIYYAGPTKTPKNLPIGSVGPTTSKRMDLFTPLMMELGVVCTIGKGDRQEGVYEAIKKNNGLYLCALGGAGALACGSISSCEEIAFLELGCESVKRLVFDNFPLYVGINANGESIFSDEPTEKGGV